MFMFMCVFVFTPPRPEVSFLSLNLIVGIVVHPLARSSFRCLPPPLRPIAIAIDRIATIRLIFPFLYSIAIGGVQTTCNGRPFLNSRCDSKTKKKNREHLERVRGAAQ